MVDGFTYGARSENRLFEKSSPGSAASEFAQAIASTIEMADALMAHNSDVGFPYEVGCELEEM